MKTSEELQVHPLPQHASVVYCLLSTVNFTAPTILRRREALATVDTAQGVKKCDALRTMLFVVVR